MEKITFCIPSKSNLRYLKKCIPSIRENAYREDHDIIVFVDSDEDGTVKWLEENAGRLGVTYYINPDIGEKLYGIGKAYDFCIEHSNTEVFMIFHADMILGKKADLKAYEQLQKSTVVCSTRIEPPIHPNAGEKIQLDLGMWTEEFKAKEFNDFVERNSNTLKTTEGIFAPWMMFKEDFLAIGGHDPVLKSCREDSDVFNRMYLKGYNFVQVWDSLVYHFTGRGAGSFSGDEQRHQQWQTEMMNSTKEFIRKWGSNVKHEPLMKPIVPPKYDVGIVLETGLVHVEYLEPWCSKIYLNDPYGLVIPEYIKHFQKETSYDLTQRVINLAHNKVGSHDIIVYIKDFNQEDFANLQMLPEIIQSTDETGMFELGNMRILITDRNELQDDLIHLKPPPYHN